MPNYRIAEPNDPDTVALLHTLLPTLVLAGEEAIPRPRRNGELRWLSGYSITASRRFVECDLLVDPERSLGTPVDASRAEFQFWKKCCCLIDETDVASPSGSNLLRKVGAMETAVRREIEALCANARRAQQLVRLRA